MSSTTSSLVGYENNNEINHDKLKRPNSKSKTTTKKKKACSRIHFNNLWSLWYGVFGTFLQAYAAVKCMKRILGYSTLTWPETHPLPVIELNAGLGLTGASVILLPFFLASAVFKIGNLANDGFKLGRQLSTCSKDTASEALGNSGGCSVWRHGGPTAPFLHLVISFSLLLPKLLMDARLIEAELLPRDSIWATDLDFMIVHRDRRVLLNFIPSTSNSSFFSFTRPSAFPIATVPPMEASSKDWQGEKPSALPFTHNIVKTLREYIGHDTHEHLKNVHSVDPKVEGSVSVEFLNFALALLVYSVRYPSIFWATNKGMGMLFSFQLLMNGVQTLLAYTGMSILYKVQVFGASKVLPFLNPWRSPGSTPFLLNPQVTLALYILSCLLVLASSLVLYLYGHTRFNDFLNHERERKVISLKEMKSSRWGYFTHCAALCILVSVGVCNAPLFHDYMVVYKGSLDGAVLACIIGGIFHIFLWIVIWLFLTIKQKWVFKIRVTVGRATIKQARSVKLVTDIDLMSSSPDDPAAQPLLILGNGRTYTVADTSPKKAIMNVIQKSAMSKKASSDNGCISNDEDEEQIYWLRPALVQAQNSPDEVKQLCWFKAKNKQKVTFNENLNAPVNRSKTANARKRTPAGEDDDGDYATLRELPLPQRSSDTGDDTASEEGKLLACVHDEHVTYASTSQDLVPPVDYEDPSPLLTPEPLSDKEDHNKHAPISVVMHTNIQPPCGQTPRCLRRADSGMPNDELTPRSDSISTEGSTPPDPPGSNHSETSSGIHSNESTDVHHFNPTQTAQQNQTRRATSVADLMIPVKEEVQWKSASLQRNVQPPNETVLQNISNAQNFNAATSSQSMFGFCGQPFPPNANCSKPSGDIMDHAIPAVILENPADSTVVIRRKINRPKTVDNSKTPVIKEEPFGRATNMRMTSFTETTDLKNIQASSATLPHYPTQPIGIQNSYPHCSTMPLPQHTSSNIANNLNGGNSCNVYPRQHSTIPTHHNGVRLFNSTNPCINRMQCNQNGSVRMINKEPIYTGVNRSSGEIYHYNS